MRRIATIALLALAVVPPAAGQNRGNKTGQAGGTEQAVRKLEDERRAALLRGDVAYYERVLADDYTGTGPDGAVSDKAQTIANAKAGNPRFESLAYDDMKVRVYGDTAVVTGRATIKGQNMGQDISGLARFLRVYVKRQGRWQLVAFQTTRVTQQ
jgi:ketosteroid isomerase-like protein